MQKALEYTIAGKLESVALQSGNGKPKTAKAKELNTNLDEFR